MRISLPRYTPVLIPTAIIVTGLAVFIYGYQLPKFTVPNGQELLNAHFPKSYEDSPYEDADWAALRLRITTRHYDFVDRGASLIAMGLTMLAIVAYKKAWTGSAFARITTSRSTPVFWMLALINWLSFIPAVVIANGIDAARDAFPYTQSNGSIEATETVEAIVQVVAGSIFIVVALLIITWRKTLPVPVSHPISAPRIGTLVVWLILLLSLITTAAAFLNGPALMPTCVISIYLLLCGRAISLSPSVIIERRRGFEVVVKAPEQG